MVLVAVFPCSDCTIKVWSLEGLSEDCNEVNGLKTKAIVAAHDKDINSLAVAPNDNYVCSGSQVGMLSEYYYSSF